MNFDLSEEQELYRASAERFAAPIDGDARRRLRTADGGYPRERWSELAELGLIALAVGEKAGGMGGSLADLAVVGEALGAANAPDPWLENGVLPALLLAAAGDEAHLPRLLDGGSFVAVALAERAQRYGLRPRATRADRDGADYRLSGEKTFVLGGALADLLLVSANLEGGTALFALPAGTSGVHVRPYRMVDGSLAAEVQFAGVRVPATARLSLDLTALEAAADSVRILAAAEMVGLAGRLHDDTLAYTRQREQFGARLSSFQALQHRLVDCYAALEQSRSMLWRTVLGASEDPGRRAGKIAGAKAYIADNALRIAREAVQMHGGMGITDELAVGHAMKRVLLLEQLFGGRSEGYLAYAEAA